MRLLLTFVFLGLVGSFVLPTLTEAGCSSSQTIRRVYVVRRSLNVRGVRPGSLCAIAHSGLILEMTDGKQVKQCVLEYMGDGRAHLYDAIPTKTSNCWFSSCKELVMKDDTGEEYDWTRQKYGTSTARYSKARISPKQAQKEMQSLMGSNYDWFTNNCHLGQERLRRSWGMHVGQPYNANLAIICPCVFPHRLPGYQLCTKIMSG